MSEKLIYRLNHIMVDEFLLSSRESFSKDDEIDFTIANRIRINQPEKKIRIESEVKLVTKNDKKTVSKIVTYLDFYLVNIEILVDNETKKLNIPNDFVKNMNAESIATTRGILFSLLKGSYLDGIFIPLIDVSNVELDLSK